MLSIDEAIAHAREVAKKKYAEGMLCHANPNDGELDGCIECAKEHEQLADWLEKLKAYESHYCSLCEKFGVNSIEEIYNKAIDDFKKEMIRSYLTEREKEYIRYKAEQLKAGGKGE